MPRPTTLPDPWLSLARKLGGVGALARELGGVTPGTIYRWAHGLMRMNGAARLLFVALCERHKVEP